MYINAVLLENFQGTQRLPTMKLGCPALSLYAKRKEDKSLPPVACGCVRAQELELVVGKRLCGKFLLPQALRFARILFKQAGVTDTCGGYRSLKYIAMLFFS